MLTHLIQLNDSSMAVDVCQQLNVCEQLGCVCTVDCCVAGSAGMLTYLIQLRTVE